QGNRISLNLLRKLAYWSIPSTACMRKNQHRVLKRKNT
ncbi:MAG: hypothetical protein ACI883_000715, partial [Candidatus Azotimanducaceae bacterium]